MRAKTKIYHIDCFRCSACARQLIPGKRTTSLAVTLPPERKRKSRRCTFTFEKSTIYDANGIRICINGTNFAIAGDEFALRDGGSLYCKEDHDVLEKSAQSRVAPPIESNNNTNLSNNNHSSEIGSMSGESKSNTHFSQPFVRAFRHRHFRFRVQLAERPAPESVEKERHFGADKFGIEI